MKHLALAIAGVAAFTASAVAAKVCATSDTTFAGGDEADSLDGALEGEFHCNVCVNAKSGKARFMCNGQVTNESGENQKSKNAPELASPGITKTLDKVKANGDATLTAKGVLPLQDLRICQLHSVSRHT